MDKILFIYLNDVKMQVLLRKSKATQRFLQNIDDVDIKDLNFEKLHCNDEFTYCNLPSNEENNIYYVLKTRLETDEEREHRKSLETPSNTNETNHKIQELEDEISILNSRINECKLFNSILSETNEKLRIRSEKIKSKPNNIFYFFSTNVNNSIYYYNSESKLYFDINLMLTSPNEIQGLEFVKDYVAIDMGFYNFSPAYVTNLNGIRGLLLNSDTFCIEISSMSDDRDLSYKSMINNIQINNISIDINKTLCTHVSGKYIPYKPYAIPELLVKDSKIPIYKYVLPFHYNQIDTRVGYKVIRVMRNSYLLGKFMYPNRQSNLYDSRSNQTVSTYGTIDGMLSIIIFRSWIFCKYNVGHPITEIIEILSYGEPFNMEDAQYEVYNINFNNIKDGSAEYINFYRMNALDLDILPMIKLKNQIPKSVSVVFRQLPNLIKLYIDYEGTVYFMLYDKLYDIYGNFIDLPIESLMTDTYFVYPSHLSKITIKLLSDGLESEGEILLDNTHLICKFVLEYNFTFIREIKRPTFKLNYPFYIAEP